MKSGALAIGRCSTRSLSGFPAKLFRVRHPPLYGMTLAGCTTSTAGRSSKGIGNNLGARPGDADILELPWIRRVELFEKQGSAILNRRPLAPYAYDLKQGGAGKAIHLSWPRPPAAASISRPSYASAASRARR